MFDGLVKLNTYIIGAMLVLTIIMLPFGSDSININIPKIKIQKNDEEKSAQVAGAYAFVPSPTVAPLPTATPTLTPTPIPIVRPIKVEIPRLEVSANIVDVGILPGHIMEIPRDPATVGWYKNSFKPGEEGAAILNGHFDDVNGQPAIFYKLESLIEGDEIIVTTEVATTFKFEVELVFSHPLEDFPEDIVYGEFEGRGLKLITCDGIWNSVQGIYSDRLVVVAHLVSK